MLQGAQSYLVLSLMIPLLSDIYVLEDIGLGLQCGINRLRFLEPVPVNSSIRLDATLKSVEAVGEGAQLVLECVIECDAAKQPALEAEIVYRFWPSSHSSMRAVRACGSG
jgi:acyl dehydratase